jgi:hypothetical protein
VASVARVAPVAIVLPNVSTLRQRRLGCLIFRVLRVTGVGRSPVVVMVVLCVPLLVHLRALE